MSHINIEVKARSDALDTIREILKSRNADFKGTDHQIDTYFKVRFGRLKLREGNIENYLIHYEREDKGGPKQSNISLYKPGPESSLKGLLAKALGILAVVDKHREIYFIDNVKFHLDRVKGLGTFVEIEAIDKDGNIGRDTLMKQCNFFIGLFKISQDDMVYSSYSDLLLRKQLPPSDNCHQATQ